MLQAVLVAVIAALPPTLMAYVAWRQLSIKSVALAEKSEQIHVLVNSNMTAVKNDLAHALTEIAFLKKALNIRDPVAPDTPPSV